MLRAAERTIIESLLEPFPGQDQSAPGAGSTALVRVAKVLQAAGLSLRAGVVCASLVAVLALCLVACGHVLAATFVLGSSALLGAAAVRRRARRRSEELERDLPALLTTIASSVRAGVDPVLGMVQARKFFRPESLVARELEEFDQRLKAGESEEAALEAFMAELSSADLQLFKRCMWLSRCHGASLAEPLHRVVRVVRQRQSFRRKTRGALAMHRMSAIGIALCAAVIGAIQFCMNDAGVRLAWEHPVGWKLLSAGGCLMGCGIGWMMSLGCEEKL